jgi:hypothetical protein
MDPVVSLVNAARTASLTCASILRDLSQAPKEFEALKNDLDLFAGYVEDVSQLRGSTNGRLRVHVSEADRTLTQITSILQKVSDPYPFPGGVSPTITKIRRFKWVTMGPALKRLRWKLMTLKDHINAEIVLFAV